MFADDEDGPKKKAFEIGEDVTLLSVDELTERIALLEVEIIRLKEAISGKQSSRAAAEDVFK